MVLRGGWGEGSYLDPRLVRSLIGPLIRASDMFFDTFSDKGN
jgi:hypothetical protein